MWSTHPFIIVIFVPAGCTGLLQPCDVGIQLPVKHSIKRSAHEDVVNEVLKQLEAGNTAAKVTIDTKIKVLRDCTVNWLWKVHMAVNKPEIVKKVRLRYPMGVYFEANRILCYSGLGSLQSGRI